MHSHTWSLIGFGGSDATKTTGTCVQTSRLVGSTSPLTGKKLQGGAVSRALLRSSKISGNHPKFLQTLKYYPSLNIYLVHFSRWIPLLCDNLKLSHEYCSRKWYHFHLKKFAKLLINLKIIKIKN
jgi:hypothetical protein